MTTVNCKLYPVSACPGLPYDIERFRTEHLRLLCSGWHILGVRFDDIPRAGLVFFPCTETEPSIEVLAQLYLKMKARCESESTSAPELA